MSRNISVALVRETFGPAGQWDFRYDAKFRIRFDELARPAGTEVILSDAFVFAGVRSAPNAAIGDVFYDSSNSNELSHKNKAGTVLPWGGSGGGNVSILSETGSLTEATSTGFTLPLQNGYMIPFASKSPNVVTKIRTLINPSNPPNSAGVIQLAIYDKDGVKLADVDVSFVAGQTGYLEGTLGTPVTPNMLEGAHMAVLAKSGDTPVLVGWTTTQNYSTFVGNTNLPDPSPPLRDSNRMLYIACY